MPHLEIHQLGLRYAPLRIAQPARQSRMIASLRACGQQTPVLVHQQGDACVLIDGYLRVGGLGALAEDRVDAWVIDVPLVDALLLGAQLSSCRPKTVLEEAWLLDELSTRHGETVKTLAAKLDRSTSWVSRRLSLVRVLPTRVQDAVRRGRLSPQGAMKSLVPLARANAQHCCQLVDNLGRRTVSVRELDRLYRGWLRSNVEVRERIVAQPELFLIAESAVRPESENAPFIRELEKIARHSTNARKLLDASTATLDKASTATWHKTLKAFEVLSASMKEKLHVGP